MPIREQDISDRLAAAAAHVSEPRFAVELVIRRIRQRRARLTAIAGTSMAVVALAAVASLFSLAPGHRPATSDTPPPRAVWLPIKISVLGQSALISDAGPRPVFAVPAGQRVPITARVSVPHGVRVPTLRLGITTVDRASGGPAGPTGWAATLLRTTKPLTSGDRTFQLRWAVPSALPLGSKVYLVAYWIADRSAPEPIIATLIIRRA